MEDIAIEEVLTGVADHLGAVQMAGAEVRITQLVIAEAVVHQEVAALPVIRGEAAKEHLPDENIK